MIYPVAMSLHTVKYMKSDQVREKSSEIYGRYVLFK